MARAAGTESHSSTKRSRFREDESILRRVLVKSQLPAPASTRSERGAAAEVSAGELTGPFLPRGSPEREGGREALSCAVTCS